MAKRKPRQEKSKAAKKSLRERLGDERFLKIYGILIIAIGVLLTLSFTSYLFSWKEDQSEILEYSWNIVFESNKNIIVSNIMGRLGAWISHVFFFRLVGIGSFIASFVLMRIGYRMLKGPTDTSFWKYILHSAFALLFIPVLASFIFSANEFPWGGAYGIRSSSFLVNTIGNTGTIVFFLVLAAVLLIWIFNPGKQEVDKVIENVDMVKEKVGGGIKIFPKIFRFRRHKTLPHPAEDEESEEQAPEASDNQVTPLVSATAKSNNPVAEKEQIKGEIIFIPEKREAKPDANTTHQLNVIYPEQTRNKPAINTTHELEIEPSYQKNDYEPKGMVMPYSGTQLEITDNTELLNDDPFVKEINPPDIQQDKELHITTENPEHLEPYDPTKDLSKYQHPSLDLLKDYDDNRIEIDRAELEANKDQIIATLLNYKIEITKIRVTVGPTVTLYEIIPAPGVRISRIKNLEDDIALSLSALGIRIIAPIPGKGTIGIEVPNKKKQMVPLKEVLNSEKFMDAKMDLPIALGKTISNEVFVADLAKMPHLLIAGATGQGKSVGINTVLMSLLYKKHPSQVKLVLVDPKKVELSIYSKIENHFLAYLPNQDEPIITETKRVVHTLTSLCLEMDTRYDLLKKAQVRNIKEYNQKFVERRLNPEKGHQFLPFIVLIIDEFADLIMTAGKEVELPIGRLAQLARAVGIHLIIATQRPSVNIITGVIKANFPARLAFKVASKIDSRTILDSGGAEQLIGQGDMLLSVGSDIVRLQCAFVDTPEVDKVINFIGDQKGYPEPFFLPEVADDDEHGDGPGSFNLNDLDEMFEDAARLVVQNRLGSTSMIQRRLKLGYNRAGRIMDQLEAMGIVGPNEGSKAREVLIMDEVGLQYHLEQLRQI